MNSFNAFECINIGINYALIGHRPSNQKNKNDDKQWEKKRNEDFVLA